LGRGLKNGPKKLLKKIQLKLSSCLEKGYEKMDLFYPEILTIDVR
jgi:hypothetical protein